MIDYLCGKDADGHPGAGMGIRHGTAGYEFQGWGSMAEDLLQPCAAANAVVVERQTPGT